MPARRPKIDKSVLAFGIPERLKDEAYTRSAQGRACDACGIENGTTVFAHFRRKGCGMQIKPHDAEGFFLCHRCHNDWDLGTNREGWVIDNIVIPQAHRRYRTWKANR